MYRTIVTTLGVLLVLILIGALVVWVMADTNQEPELTTPAPAASPLTSPSPSPDTQLLQGRIIDISDRNIGFMNARVVTIQTNQMPANVYVTEDTEIINVDGETAELSDFQENQVIDVTGEPSEGGVLASRVEIIRGTVSPSPSPSAASPSPSPTPADSPAINNSTIRIQLIGL